jgi:hypothetical protein
MPVVMNILMSYMRLAFALNIYNKKTGNFDDVIEKMPVLSKVTSVSLRT